MEGQASAVIYRAAPPSPTRHLRSMGDRQRHGQSQLLALVQYSTCVLARVGVENRDTRGSTVVFPPLLWAEGSATIKRARRADTDDSAHRRAVWALVASAPLRSAVAFGLRHAGVALGVLMAALTYGP